ncbi:MAG: UDP-N-acetylglucosamine--N-acetylmuramyl-(pentapeptide) pyrophosphoryl-undecaprenol N-acetylglucosamine transferase [Clostridia bacterium]|nr:UDP-N-acetylglucosamine--N-acetylmuramyl-(pentapeptide) pyrophosphoryl-undecaprenol N-acetylglucosamine transferase [Clostridia bacterium]
MKKILFTGGGSAGHVVPNVALIEELLSEGKTDVCYMGTDGIEKNIVAEWKIPYYTIHCPKLVRGGGFSAFKKNLKIPLELRRAIKAAEEGLKKYKPDLVFSKGGYVSLPVILAARKLKIPCYAHESDFSAGLANRLTARKCKTVFTSFPETANALPNGKYSGAPLRRSLFHYTRAEARKSLEIPFRTKVVLIFGGGSGSAAINEAVRKHLKSLTEDYVILHVCGKGNAIETNIKNYRQFEFVADMGILYACADLVIARSGAGTVFEVLALKKPSVFIPLEGQTRGDQWENAEYFRRKGLCRILPQSEVDKLPKAIAKALADEDMRAKLQESNFLCGNKNILRELRAALQN